MTTPKKKTRAVRKGVRKAGSKRAATPRKAAKARRTVSPKRLVDKAIQNIGSKLETDEVKGSYSDLIRLLQLKKELQAEAPREVQVRWGEEKSSE